MEDISRDQHEHDPYEHEYLDHDYAVHPSACERCQQDAEYLRQRYIDLRDAQGWWGKPVERHVERQPDD